MSLSKYFLSEIRQVAERPTLDELRARLERRPPMTPSVAPVQAVRAERDRQWWPSMLSAVPEAPFSHASRKSGGEAAIRVVADSRNAVAVAPTC